MARGHQKIQSQQKNAKKQADIKKSKGHDQKTAAKAALVFTCGVCKVCNETIQWLVTTPLCFEVLFFIFINCFYDPMFD